MGRKRGMGTGAGAYGKVTDCGRERHQRQPGSACAHSGRRASDLAAWRLVGCVGVDLNHATAGAGAQHLCGAATCARGWEEQVHGLHEHLQQREHPLMTTFIALVVMRRNDIPMMDSSYDTASHLPTLNVKKNEKCMISARLTGTHVRLRGCGLERVLVLLPVCG
jgi:hypothetical protein